VRYPEILHFNLHWDGYGEDHKSEGCKIEDPTLPEGFHTVGLEWTPTHYILYLDGKEVHRTGTAVSHRDQYIILSLEVGEWAGAIAEAPLPDEVLFDYVRVYKKKYFSD
jgi:beta-glucanase (GH16 family)